MTFLAIFLTVLWVVVGAVLICFNFSLWVNPSALVEDRRHEVPALIGLLLFTLFNIADFSLFCSIYFA